MMQYQNCLVSAIESVLGWDLPDESLPELIRDRARALAGLSPDDLAGGWRI